MFHNVKKNVKGQNNTLNCKTTLKNVKAKKLIKNRKQCQA